jgi:hypothetical protein
VGDLLTRLKPDVHCKGTDYTVETVPERAIVERWRTHGDLRRSQRPLDPRPRAEDSRVTLLVVRLGALGDIVHTVPAVAAITRALPGARIDWLVERKHRPVLDLFDLDVRPIEIEGGSVGAFLGAMRGLRANGMTSR